MCVQAIFATEGKTGKTYIRSVWCLFDPDVEALGERHDLDSIRVPFLDDLVDEALAGARGQALGGARVLLRIIATRGLAMTPHYQAMVEDCTDLDQIEAWVDRAVLAATVEEIFQP
jgi:hypothetical protein